MRTKKGFTLIELLVVIAIIAILAAILFPVFMSARARARTIKCMAHGKQLGQATMMYLGDNNDRFASTIEAWPEPQKTQANNYLDSITWEYLWGAGTKWERKIWNANKFADFHYVQLRKYVKNDDIWICPDPNTMYAKRYAYGGHMSWEPMTGDDDINGDYGFTDNNGLGRTLAEVQDLDRQGQCKCGPRYMPSTKKIMWMCYALGRWANNGNVGDGKWPWIFPSYAHARGSVFVYADGHAVYRDMGQGWAPLGYTKLAVDQTP